MTAKKKNVRNTIAKAGGRPTKWSNRFIKQAEVACREGGFTDLKLAKLFDCTVTCLTNWRHKYPEFLAAIRKGKDEFDTLNVEKDLLKRARGFKYVETTKEPVTTEIRDEDGEVVKKVQKLATTKTVRKLIVPDVTAQIFWLKNRNPDRWRDKRDYNLSGADGEKLNIKVSFLKPEKKR